MNKDVVVFYCIPAYGHVYSQLYLMETLVKKGFRVVCYASERFCGELEGCGCQVLEYPERTDQINLSDGKKILKLYRLILQYTWKMEEKLVREARKLKPVCCIYDSLALWGRGVAEQLGVPGISFYSIAAIDRIWSSGFLAYMRGFSTGFFRYMPEAPKALGYRKRISREYGHTSLGILGTLMNQGDLNVMGYSREFQPGGIRFDKRYLFLGPGACRRKAMAANTFSYPKDNLIYCSLGTIFNEDKEFYQALFRQFGGSKYHVILSGDMGRLKGLGIPENVTVSSFVNQREVFEHAVLFITSGGLNGMHEALMYGVPCLGYPQQGEQELNLKRIEKLGFGQCLKSPEFLRQQAEKLIGQRECFNEDLLMRLTADHMDEFLQRFHMLLDGRGGL